MVDYSHRVYWDTSVNRAIQVVGKGIDKGAEFLVWHRFLGVHKRFVYHVMEYEPGSKALIRGSSGESGVFFDAITVNPTDAGSALNFVSNMNICNRFYSMLASCKQSVNSAAFMGSMRRHNTAYSLEL